MQGIPTRLDVFQSTLPVRGATTPNTLSPTKNTFQSTLPVRGATKTLFNFISTLLISIHAPREGSDLLDQPSLFVDCYFNPRSP